MVGRTLNKSNSKKNKHTPPIRVLHHMARSGGTVISKCLATMENVVLLSEIHSSAVNQLYPQLNPMRQFHEWYGLFTRADLERLKRPISFMEGIALIYRRCIENGKVLVLRDWSHLDYTAVPFLPAPTYRLTMVELLRQQFPVVNTATVRHPITQWLSLSRLQIMQGKLTLDMYLKGYRQFAECCEQIGFVRYEDFSSEPEVQLGILCERLSLAYDQGWRERWWRYTNMTGDMYGKREGTEIKAKPIKVEDQDLLAAFAQNKDYQHSLEILGYEHPL